MQTCIALLRGINIAGHNRLPMRALVALLVRMGCKDIKTYIQSGNAVFRTGRGPTRQFAEQIGSRIHKTHDFKPKVLLLSPADLKAAMAHNPFRTARGTSLHFMFLERRPRKPDLAGLMAVKAKSERFHLRGKVFYLYAPRGVGRSQLVARIEPALGVAVTGRNWNTVRKLMAMVEAE